MLTSGGSLRYSTDTLTFDTVFTAFASFTTQVKIYNPQDQPVTISSIRLEKGNTSYFHINVNGYEGSLVKNIEIAPNDSIYVFATVNVDPTNENTPFIITDNLIATLNGSEYKLPFLAYGQNAHYIVDSVLETQTWLIDKPYVIIRNALVDSGHTLTIPAGCRIYMNADSRLFVAGTLLAVGTKTDSIVFQGGRLDRKYFGNEGYPGEWGGLYFTGQGFGSKLDYVTLKNCGNSTRLGDNTLLPAAIQVNPSTTGSTFYTLEMYHTTIENSIGYGILSFTGAIYAQNCLINTCGAHALGITQGGSYRFDNCTFVTYGTDKVSHIDNPAVVIHNYVDINNTRIVGPLNCVLNNCIAYGSLETEIDLEKEDATGSQYEVTLNNCLLKSKDGIPAHINQNDCIINQDPQFEDYKNWNYRLKAESPAVNRGRDIAEVQDDLDAKPRQAGKYDIGCYERQ